jgi:hypothetical protein
VTNVEHEPMTTRQKIDALIDAVRSTPKDEHSGELGELVDVLNIATGLLGRDPLDFIFGGKSDAELDLFVDKTIALLLEIRGDDLPAFDPAMVELGE